MGAVGVLALLLAAAAAHVVTLSNTELPRDTAGMPLVTGEMSVLNNLERDGWVYLYMTNWGCCEQVDCCQAGLPWPENRCWECCPALIDAGCIYSTAHSFSAYRTKDMAAWEHLDDVVGGGLPSRNPGARSPP